MVKIRNHGAPVEAFVSILNTSFDLLSKGNCAVTTVLTICGQKAKRPLPTMQWLNNYTHRMSQNVNTATSAPEPLPNFKHNELINLSINRRTLVGQCLPIVSCLQGLKTDSGQRSTCLGMSRTLRVDMRSGRTGGSSGVSPMRTISLTVRRGQLPRRVTQGCFIILPSVIRSLGFCSRHTGY